MIPVIINPHLRLYNLIMHKSRQQSLLVMSMHVIALERARTNFGPGPVQIQIIYQ